MPKRPIIAVVLSFVIAFSLIALTQLQKTSHISPNIAASMASPTFPIQQAFNNLETETQTSLNYNSTRTSVYNFIVANPGLQFRGICAGLGIAIGTAEFHLGVLMKAGLISFVRDGKYKRFFVIKKFSAKEIKLVSLLRHETVKEILRTIAVEKTVSHCKLASTLSITSQGLTWQMNRLVEQKIVRETCTSTKVTYYLNDAFSQDLIELLQTIKP